MRSLALAVLTLAACNLNSALDSSPWTEPDGTVDADGLDAETEDSSGGDVDAENERSGGSVTHVVQHVELIQDRLCDLDGDGLNDSALADLGSPSAELFAAAINAALAGNFTSGDDAYLFHFPWIDDLSGPSDTSTLMIMFDGIDTDVPPDSSDSFTGSEPFLVSGTSVDACGEPRSFFRGVEIDDGEAFVTLDAEMPLPGATFSAYFHEARGTMASYGESGEMFLCVHASIHALGEAESIEETDALTMLEFMVAGGAPLGLPVAGLSPDVDLDGDGLERIVVDELGHVEACIDGDNTELVGRNCWSDARMVDGFSLNIRTRAVSAVLAGLEPGWEDDDGPCEDQPEESLWDPP